MNPAEGATTAGPARPVSCAIIANPTAGASRNRLLPDAARELCRRHGLPAELLVTRHPGEAAELAATAARRHPVVVALGGDGTVHEVASGLLGSQAALAVLPSGSGNDFAWGLGITSPEIGLRAATAGRVRRIDVAYLDGRPFFNSAGFFLSGLVSGRAKRLWRGAGRWRYVMAALSALCTYRPQAARWSLAGGSPERAGRWLLAEVANGPSSGGGFLLAPDAEPGDGMLDFCLVSPVSLWTISRLFPAAARGDRFEHPCIARPRADAARFRCEEAVPVHLDGEPEMLPAGEHALSLEPGRLAVLAPPAKAPRSPSQQARQT